MNFKMMMAMVLRILGIANFNKDASNKMVLEEAQETKLKETFGAEFTNIFTKGLSDFTESNAEQNSSAAQDAGGIGDQMMEALRQHNANALNAKMEGVLTKMADLETKNQTLEGLIAKLSDTEETLPEANGGFKISSKEGVAAVMKVNMSKPHYKAVTSFMQTGSAMAASGTTIEVGDLKQEFGTYLNIQRNLDIITQLFQGFTSAKYFKTVFAVTEWRASQALITSVVQQFSSEWTPSGKAKFTPITIKNRRHKINVPIKPAEVLDSYIFFLYDEQLSPDQMPITKYIIENLIKPKILQDIELRMIFKGKFVEALDVEENDAATPPEDAMDGLETILVEAKASADKGILFFTPSFAYNWVNASDEDVIKFFNEYVDWISPMYQGFAMNVYCSREHWKRYRRAYKNIWGTNSGQAGDFGTDTIDFSTNTLVPLDGMYGSPVLFATPKDNMIKLRNKNEVPNIINDIQKSNYTVKIFGEFWLGVGFAIGEGVFAYVPAGYNPKTKVVATHGEAHLFPGEEESDGSGI